MRRTQRGVYSSGPPGELSSAVGDASPCPTSTLHTSFDQSNDGYLSLHRVHYILLVPSPIYHIHCYILLLYALFIGGGPSLHNTSPYTSGARGLIPISYSMTQHILHFQIHRLGNILYLRTLGSRHTCNESTTPHL